jgi:hypothetical protein
LVDDTLTCTGGATGFACAVGDNPEIENAELSCSTPYGDGANNDYCCFDWPYGLSVCVPDDQLTAACPNFGSFGYRCEVGTDPILFDPMLTCSLPVGDPDGVDEDYCCTN